MSAWLEQAGNEGQSRSPAVSKASPKDMWGAGGGVLHPTAPLAVEYLPLPARGATHLPGVVGLGSPCQLGKHLFTGLFIPSSVTTGG